MNLHNNFNDISGYFLFLGYFQLKKFIINRKKVIKIKLRQKDVKIITCSVKSLINMYKLEKKLRTSVSPKKHG